MTATLPPLFALSNGALIPRIGLGTWPMSNAEAEQAVAEAIAIGYRLFDTAHAYGNEQGVGNGIRASGVARQDVFVTSKLNGESHGIDEAQRAFEVSARRLGVDYLDLYLIHWPIPSQNRFVEAWRGMSALLDDGRVRAIGVSNFKASHIDRLLHETGIVPHLNQVQISPYLTRDPIREYDERHGIATQSWSPIDKGGSLLSEPSIVALAEKYQKTPAQIVLRWHLELGLITVPKSANPVRMRENLDIFDFGLDGSDVSLLSALDRGDTTALDSDIFGH